MALSPDQYHLKWHNFTAAWMQSFHDLVERQDFVDVTLVTAEKRVQAHKLVLSASSDLFWSLLKGNESEHATVILSDIEYANLAAILRFIYYGEVSMPQEQMESFFEAAKTLKIKGIWNEREISDGNKENQDIKPLIDNENPDVNNTCLSADGCSSSKRARTENFIVVVDGSCIAQGLDLNQADHGAHFGREVSNNMQSNLSHTTLYHPQIHHNVTHQQPVIQEAHLVPGVGTFPFTSHLNPQPSFVPATDGTIAFNENDEPNKKKGRKRKRKIIINPETGAIIASSDKPGMCPLCFKKLNQARNLKRHIAKCHVSAGKSPENIQSSSACPECGQLVSLTDFYQHMAEMHRQSKLTAAVTTQYGHPTS